MNLRKYSSWVAMGLALKDKNREEAAISYYNVLSTFDAMSSTPTLFNAGTIHSQLSSCYLSTIQIVCREYTQAFKITHYYLNLLVV